MLPLESGGAVREAQRANAASRSAIALCVALVSTACASDGSSPGPSIGSIASAIQGGAADATDMFAVGVCQGSPGSCALLCSGTLISPNLVLTARHCVEAVEPSTTPLDCATAVFGAPLAAPGAYAITTASSMRQSTTGWHSVAQILTPTGADQTGACTSDLALLVLGDTVASREASPATPNVSIPLTDHARLEPAFTAIGYGLAAASGDAASGSGGQRRILQNIPIDCIPNDPDPSLACSASEAASLGIDEVAAGDGLCDGDSGSSAFEQTSFSAGVPLAIGVLSRGGVAADDPTQCAASVYTRLDLWRDFLVSGAVTAAQLGGYPVPAWALGDDDGGAPADGSTPGADASSSLGSAPSHPSASSGCTVAPSPGTEHLLGFWASLSGLTVAITRRRRHSSRRRLS